MRYAVPVNGANEVEALAAAGADELYCGVLEPWWERRYGNHDSSSRRQGKANLSSRGELRDVVHAADAYGLAVFLALNARYSEPQLDYLVGLCEAFEGYGGRGVIVSDLGLLWRLRGNTSLRVTLSLLAVAQNVPTIQAFADLGVSRVVLPRFVDWREAGTLLHPCGGMEAEAMAFFDKCPWVDGYCRHPHLVSFPEVRGNVTAHDEPLLTFDTTYRTHACLGGACSYVEPYPCAACFLERFEHAGVGVAKLGGRGRPLAERVRALSFLRAAKACASDDQRARLYRRTFGQQCACYYGEHTQRRDAIEPTHAQSASDERTYVGSETSVSAFREALAKLMDGPRAEGPLTILVPPLSQRSLEFLARSIEGLDVVIPEGTHLCVNDLGTLVTLARLLRDAPSHMVLRLGTLLARGEDPRVVAHFLSPEQNPPRLVTDEEGRVRALTYAPPPDELTTHWRSWSTCEPSAMRAVAELTGIATVEREFP